MYRQQPTRMLLNLLGAAALALSPVAVQATLVTTSFQGTVTADNGGSNPFGLTTGDIISASATYDDALVAGTSADEVLAVAPNGWDFSITLGSFTFGQADLPDPDYTRFFFNFGEFDGIRFFLEPIAFVGFGDQTIEDFNGGRSLFVEAFPGNDPILLEADWDFTSKVTVPVEPGPGPGPAPMPVPASALLLLAGLLLLSRRRA